jgi:DNA-binding XRE family transcriptional regulator
MHASAMRRNRVRELRAERLMTQLQLAHRASVALRTIQSVEKGFGCRRDTMRKILRGLGVPFQEWREVFLPTTPARPQPAFELRRPLPLPPPVEVWQDIGARDESFLNSGI